MDFVAYAQKINPDSLFIIFGDHRPFGYLENQGIRNQVLGAQTTLALFLGPWGKDFIQEHQDKYISAFEIPLIILDRLGMTSSNAIELFRQTKSDVVRTILGSDPVIVNRQTGDIRCQLSSIKEVNSCPQSKEIIESMKTIVSDSLLGKSFTEDLPTN